MLRFSVSGLGIQSAEVRVSGAGALRTPDSQNLQFWKSKRILRWVPGALKGKWWATAVQMVLGREHYRIHSPTAPSGPARRGSVR